MNKKLFILSLVLVFSISISAQEPTQGLGFQLGFAEPFYRLNSPTLTDKTELEKTPLNGFKAGLVYDASFIKGFGATLALNYTFAMTQTDWASKNSGYTYPMEKSQQLYHQLELAVDWQYKFEVAKSTFLILYTGPTIQCGLAYDRRIFTQTQFQQESLSQVSCYDYEDDDLLHDYNRLNVTWGVGAGFQYERFFIRGGYDFGIMNPYHYSNFNKISTSYDDRNTRGRLDQWAIKLGVYIL